MFRPAVLVGSFDSLGSFSGASALASDLGGAFFDSAPVALGGLPAHVHVVDASLNAAPAVMIDVWGNESAASLKTEEERLRRAVLVVSEPQLEAIRGYLARRAATSHQ